MGLRKPWLVESSALSCVSMEELRQLLDESIAASLRNELLAHQLSLVEEDGW
jgi:hypothetical protein